MRYIDENKKCYVDADPEQTNTDSPEASEEPCIVLGRPKHKKNYDELNPFKFFCDQCSFKVEHRESTQYRKFSTQYSSYMLQ